ncbi:hypothetical protein [Duganella sp. Leaf126]|uniref:hypothetical protein n=1 Tax=Duganella sp. Leaf126 TaxID=1736266 RepID=UPI000AE026E6|nr:hypothetical protein [Duganella sp. Leaf126]
MKQWATLPAWLLALAVCSPAPGAAAQATLPPQAARNTETPPAAAAAAAADTTGASAAQPARVVVATTRDPVDKSYRKMVAGMDRFERLHALAPQATLRFQLLPRLSTTELDGMTLRVVGDTMSLPVAVAPDHTFTLPRDARALDQDAALVASRKTSTLTWRAQVRSPGVPAGMRRLGDLRLECQVGVAAGLLSNNAHLFAWLDSLLTDPDRVCGAADGNYLFFAERPVFGVTLQHGGRRAALPFDLLYAGGQQTPETLPYCDCQVLLDRSYYAPLWDSSWPDDTLLAFDYMDDAPVTTLAPGYGSTAAVRAGLGPATVVRFDSGLQVWRYRYPQAATAGQAAGQDGQPAYADFVILFGADGVARKARLTEPLNAPVDSGNLEKP